MLYLADEMFKNRHKTFKVTIGKPIPWQTFDKSRSATEWADYVRELVYKLVKRKYDLIIDYGRYNCSD